eukprot:TRINITY_DN64052_c0_g1_i1.p1 TRINITY_DN64052_c0_g1~~TRINITY_DN64052_c0_g1_i1.p1  ORF type:complete len:579 (+),score=12.90 TRINITY_DN64052_c0_g1_i1:42-1739(+)
MDADVTISKSEDELYINVDDVAQPEATNQSRVHASKSKSWNALPQEVRGITLAELWRFYNSHKEWLETLVWRCDACHRSCQQDSGPCPHCNNDAGEMQTRNLYEVCDALIKPICEAEQVSYVQHLQGLTPQRIVPVETFVSHWWGGEFSKFMRTLDCYARERAASDYRRCKCSGRWVSVIGLALWPGIIVLSSVLLGLDLSQSFRSSHPLRSPFMWTCACMSLALSALTGLCAHLLTRRRKRHPGTWGFWICAFANNQFAVDHATGIGSDALESAFAVALQADSCKEVMAVFDRHGQIYTRIWCAFELFLASKLDVSVALGNEHGLISEGDASEAVVLQVQSVISSIRIDHAQASKEEDRLAILRAMERGGTTTETLDDFLRTTARYGLLAVALRRRTPLIFCLTLPLCSACLTGALSKIGDVIMSKRSTIGPLSFGNPLLEAVLYLLTSGLCLFLLQWCLLGCRGNWSPFHKRVQRRVGTIITMCTAPSLLYQLGEYIETYVLKHATISVTSGGWASIIFASSATAQLALVVVGTLSGLFYYCARDYTCLQRARRKIETTLLFA